MLDTQQTISTAAVSKLSKGAAPRNYLAALALFLLPAISVELLTGDISLRNFFHPIGFLLLTITYGGALLLIRETVVRWKKGFASILVLAAAYGMVNEAICSKGFFDPHFYAVVENGLEGFGRWFGINVPWALSISIFHAIFSIIVPFVIVSAIFPGPKAPDGTESSACRERWVGNGLYAAIMIIFVSVIAFSFMVLSPTATHYKYSEGPGPIALVLSLIAVDILIAWKLPAPRPHRWRLRLPTPAFFVFGVVYAFAYFVSSRILRATGSPVAFVAFDLLFFVALPLWFFFKLPEPPSRGKIALVTGLLVPLLMVAKRVGSGGVVAAIIVIALLIIAFLRSGRGIQERASPFS